MTTKNQNTSATFFSVSRNYLLRQKYGRLFLFALGVSVFAHFLIYAGMPSLAKDYQAPEQTVMQLVELPPEVMIPAPPPPLPKPEIALPSLEDEQLASVTIPKAVPPPPMPEVMPEFSGPVFEQLMEEYIPTNEALPRYSYIPPKPSLPRHLQETKVNAVTVLEFDLSDEGKLKNGTSEVTVSSGFPELDKLALEWASEIRMQPAMSQGEPTEVRISIPLRWVAR